jgi:hypothetical protein
LHLLTFYGCLDRRGYLTIFGISIAAFVASVFAFPFLVAGLQQASGCRGIGGACGALGVVVAVAYKPLAAALFIGSLIGPALRRARDAGLPSFVGVLVPLLFAADFQFLIFAVAPWAFAFAAGALSVTAPQFAIVGIISAVALGLLPTDRPRDDRPWSAPERLVAVLGTAVALLAAINAARGIPGLSWLLVLLGPAFRIGHMVAPYLLAAFVVTLAWLVWSAVAAPASPRISRHPADAQREIRTRPGTGLANVPIWPPAVVALILTAVAFLAANWNQGLLLLPMIAMSLTPIVLPTFLLYFIPAWLGWAALVSQRRFLVALLGLSMLPYFHWGYAHWSAYRARVQEAAEISRVPTKALSAGMPSTIVFESRSTTGLRGLITFPGVEHVISKGAYFDKLMQFDKRGKNGKSHPPVAVSSLPNRYLLLKQGRNSSFAKKTIYAAAGGPLELRMVDGVRDDLIALWYRTYHPSPSALPLLATHGWFRGSNTATTDDHAETVRVFLETALARRMG